MVVGEGLGELVVMASCVVVGSSCLVVGLLVVVGAGFSSDVVVSCSRVDEVVSISAEEDGGGVPVTTVVPTIRVTTTTFLDEVDAVSTGKVRQRNSRSTSLKALTCSLSLVLIVYPFGTSSIHLERRQSSYK